jgi:hypothetical protein
MAKTERCPICGVAVKTENLLRHLNDNHPRHPDTSRLVARLKEEPGRLAAQRSSRPFRLSRLHVTIVALVVVLGVGAYAVAPYLNPGAGKPLPCVSGRGDAYHWHTALEIDSGATPVTIPGGIGISPGCMQLLHTHEADGTIHIEPDTPEQARLYTIGEFFAVWGKPFGSPTQMHVNGTPVTPSPSVILHNQATIHIGYAFFAA